MDGLLAHCLLTSLFSILQLSLSFKSPLLPHLANACIQERTTSQPGDLNRGRNWKKNEQQRTFRSSKRDMQWIINPEHLVAIGAFPQSGCHSLVDTFPAKHMTACLDGCVLEIKSADCADGQCLKKIKG